MDAFLERLIIEAGPVHLGNGDGPPPPLPGRHLGVIGSLHRRDIYDDVG